MSEQPVITLEELKKIIENVSPLDIKTVIVNHYDPDEYIIVKGGLEISFGKPCGETIEKTYVIFNIKNDNYSKYETYDINYHELIAPLKNKSFVGDDDRRNFILDTFGIEDKPSDSL